jgi:hypothetical protein
MDTEQIERLLTSVSNFQGVFSSDTLPDHPCLLVCNTDPAAKPGVHWIAISIERSGYGEYFDSFGRKPNELFARYMDANCIKWTFNQKQLQSRISAFCGYYCCVFIKLSGMGYDMTKIVARFTNDTGFNDWLVHRLICNKR